MNHILSKIGYSFIIAITVVLVAYYLLAPLLQYLFNKVQQGNKKRTFSLDLMIRRKEQIMRQGTETPKSGHNSRETHTSKTIKKYIEAFKADSSNSELKGILKIFDDLEWGEGEFINKELATIKKKYVIDQGPASLTRSLNDLIQRDFLISLHSTELASIKQISKLLRLKSLFETLIHEAQLRSGATMELMAKKYHTQTIDFILAFEVLVLINSGKNKEQAYNAIMTSTAKTNSLLPQDTKKVFIKFVFNDDRSDFTSCEQLTEQIAIQAKAVTFISPLPKITNKNDLKTAYKILSVNENTQVAELKKRYKKMAIAKHPDKISSYGIPKKYEKNASENFARLKAAYDIIIEKVNKKS